MNKIIKNLILLISFSSPMFSMENISIEDNLVTHDVDFLGITKLMESAFFGDKSAERRLKKLGYPGVRIAAGEYARFYIYNINAFAESAIEERTIKRRSNKRRSNNRVKIHSEEKFSSLQNSLHDIYEWDKKRFVGENYCVRIIEETTIDFNISPSMFVYAVRIFEDRNVLQKVAVDSFILSILIDKQEHKPDRNYLDEAYVVKVVKLLSSKFTNSKNIKKIDKLFKTNILYEKLPDRAILLLREFFEYDDMSTEDMWSFQGELIKEIPNYVIRKNIDEATRRYALFSYYISLGKNIDAAKELKAIVDYHQDFEFYKEALRNLIVISEEKRWLYNLPVYFELFDNQVSNTTDAKFLQDYYIKYAHHMILQNDFEQARLFLCRGYDDLDEEISTYLLNVVFGLYEPITEPVAIMPKIVEVAINNSQPKNKSRRRKNRKNKNSNIISETTQTSQIEPEFKEASPKMALLEFPELSKKSKRILDRLRVKRSELIPEKFDDLRLLLEDVGFEVRVMNGTHTFFKFDQQCFQLIDKDDNYLSKIHNTKKVYDFLVLAGQI